MDKKSSLLLPLLIAILCIGCGSKETWQRSTFIYFDTVCEVELLCHPPEFKQAQEAVQRIFSDVESLFSPQASPSSSPMVVKLYQKALKVYHDSDGCFDITVGPLTKIWGFWDESFRLPTQVEIDKCLTSVGMKKLEEEDGFLRLPPDFNLDWGGIAKGFGIDLAYQTLLSMGLKRGFLNSGGDLICWGENPENKYWQVGVKHPRESGYLGVLSISNVAAATTGDYQRFFVENGIRYHHVLNPRTGYPAQGKQSVTVVGPETTICDALSTALFVSEKPELILKIYPDYGAIVVDREGKISILGKAYAFRLL